MAKEFDLHPKLAEDCVQVTSLDLCDVLLMNDSRFPWLILVPRRTDLRDFHEIAVDDRDTLLDEMDRCSRLLSKLPEITKINVAALGNQVPQLHVHVIARSTNDAAWPGPVWGQGTVVPYDEAALNQMVDYMVDNLSI